MRSIAFTIGLLLTACVGSTACRSGDAAMPQPTAREAGASVAASSPTPSAGSSSSAAPTGAATSPTSAECVALWDRYHALSPDDPYVARDRFVARCGRSARAVLTCPERARAEVVDIVRQSRAPDDGGAPEPPAEQVVERLLPVVLPSRAGICMTRERLRFALGAGELRALAQEIAAARIAAGTDGVAVAAGSFATLPAVGMVEGEKSAALGPAGEVRVSRRADGTLWLYFLGGLLGRHQNQVGFLYSTEPFVNRDFAPEGEGHESVCIAPSEEGAPLQHERYLLPCFTLLDRLAPDLIEVGSAPD